MDQKSNRIRWSYFYRSWIYAYWMVGIMTKTDAKKFLTVGNHKLNKNIATFDIPAIKEICGQICPGCYAEKAQKIYPAVLPSRMLKYDLSKSETFVSIMTAAIKALNMRYIRIHSSGEMYNQEYLDKWSKIVQNLPTQQFFVYTKKIKHLDFSKLFALPNIVVIDSLKWGKLNYGTLKDKPNNSILCPDHPKSGLRSIYPTGPICGTHCTICMDKTTENYGVYFIKH